MTRKSVVIPAVCAGIITGLSVIGNFAAIGFPSPGQRIAVLVALPAVPGDLLAAFLGLGHGPDGFPNQDDMSPYVFTFLLWWGLLYFVGRWWTGRGATNH